MGVTLLALSMFFFGAGMFTYQGPELSPFIFQLGKYSFMLWLPALLIGIILLCIGRGKE
jgi:hypothetical protein